MVVDRPNRRVVFTEYEPSNCVRAWYYDGGEQRITTIAGSPGQSGCSEGPIGGSLLQTPYGVAIDPLTGCIVVADYANNRLVWANEKAGTLQTIAGDAKGAGGFADGSGT